MEPNEDAQVKRLAILAAARVGLHELRKTAVVRSSLVAMTYMGMGAILILLSGWGGRGLLAAAGVVTLIMAVSVYMRQRGTGTCCEEMERYEEEFSDLVGNGGSLAEADGTSVVASVLEMRDRSQEWTRALLREYGAHLAWILVTAAVLALASGMAEGGWQMVLLQISAVYLALSVLASDLRPVRTLLAWRRALRSAKEAGRSLIEGTDGRDLLVIVRIQEKLEARGGSLNRTTLKIVTGVDNGDLVRGLELLQSNGMIAVVREGGSEAIAITAKGADAYGLLLTSLEETMNVDF